MRSRRRLFLLITLGNLAACAEIAAPNGSETTEPAADASTDRKKDTATSSTDDGAVADDTGTTTKKDAGKDTGTTVDDASVDDAAVTDSTVPDVAVIPDTSTPDTTTPVDAGCNDLDFSGSHPELTVNYVDAGKPTPTGGTLLDGTYYSTAFTAYSSGSTKYTLRAVVRIAGNKIDTLKDDFSGTGKKLSGTYTVSGKDITITSTCGASESGEFTVTGANTFVYYQTSSTCEGEFTS